MTQKRGDTNKKCCLLQENENKDVFEAIGTRCVVCFIFYSFITLIDHYINSHFDRGLFQSGNIAN